jgi:hypothetical protein
MLASKTSNLRECPPHKVILQFELQRVHHQRLSVTIYNKVYIHIVTDPLRNIKPYVISESHELCDPRWPAESLALGHTVRKRGMNETKLATEYVIHPNTQTKHCHSPKHYQYRVIFESRIPQAKLLHG